MKDGKSQGIDSSPEYCKIACAKSLSILGIDSIDICKNLTLLLHTTFPKAKPPITFKGP